MDREIFGKHLKLLIKRAGLTQDILSKRTGINITSISKFANGHRLPAFENIVPLANALRVTCDEFLMQTPSIDYTPINIIKTPTTLKELDLLGDAIFIGYYDGVGEELTYKIEDGSLIVRVSEKYYKQAVEERRKQ